MRLTQVGNFTCDTQWQFYLFHRLAHLHVPPGAYFTYITGLTFYVYHNGAILPLNEGNNLKCKAVECFAHNTVL